MPIARDNNKKHDPMQISKLPKHLYRLPKRFGISLRIIAEQVGAKTLLARGRRLPNDKSGADPITTTLIREMIETGGAAAEEASKVYDLAKAVAVELTLRTNDNPEPVDSSPAKNSRAAIPHALAYMVRERWDEWWHRMEWKQKVAEDNSRAVDQYNDAKKIVERVFKGNGIELPDRRAVATASLPTASEVRKMQRGRLLELALDLRVPLAEELDLFKLRGRINTALDERRQAVQEAAATAKDIRKKLTTEGGE